MLTGGFLRLVDNKALHQRVRPYLERLGCDFDADAEVETLSLAQRQLVETIEFLELWNRDAHEDWFAEIGVPRPSGLRVCLPGQAENEGQ